MKSPAVLPVPTVAQPFLQAALEVLANSASFRKVPALRELLLYLWERRETPPSEYAIGIEVLGRKEDFDPNTDSAVRVDMSRLRAWLKDHYEANPAPLRFTVPPGEYRLEVPQFAPAPLPATRREFPWKVSAAGLLAFYDLRLSSRARPQSLLVVPPAKRGPQTRIVPPPMSSGPANSPFLRAISA